MRRGGTGLRGEDRSCPPPLAGSPAARHLSTSWSSKCLLMQSRSSLSISIDQRCSQCTSSVPFEDAFRSPSRDLRGIRHASRETRLRRVARSRWVRRGRGNVGDEEPGRGLGASRTVVPASEPKGNAGRYGRAEGCVAPVGAARGVGALGVRIRSERDRGYREPLPSTRVRGVDSRHPWLVTDSTSRPHPPAASCRSRGEWFRAWLGSP